MHGQLEEHSPHQKRPRLQQTDRIIAQLPARTEAVIHRHAHRTRDARDQRHRRHGKRRQVAVRGQQNHAEQRQHDAHDLIRARLSVRARAGDQQHHHRRQVLHDRADRRVGKLNGQKVKKLEKQKRRLQRSISRSYEKNKKGESYCKTNNVIKKEKLLLKRNHRLTNIRKNHLNQTISEIVNRKPRFICIEDLNVSGMMKNRHLSKAVQEQGFFWFRKQLEYKCSDKGIQLIVADRFYPSSKLCSCCGNIKKDLKLSDREYRCECGNIIDRDFQVSINLKGYGERFAS